MAYISNAILVAQVGAGVIADLGAIVGGSILKNCVDVVGDIWDSVVVRAYGFHLPLKVELTARPRCSKSKRTSYPRFDLSSALQPSSSPSRPRSLQMRLSIPNPGQERPSSKATTREGFYSFITLRSSTRDSSLSPCRS